MIQFANPAALWLLTLAIPIILLYLLKRKRREVIVPSLLLWKQALEDLRAQTPFQKLRTNLLLFLQLFALVLITAILSQPYLPGSGTSRKFILVLDTSASMKATDESPSRFRKAQDQLLQVLDRANPLDEVLLVTFSSETSVLQSFSRNHASLRTQLQSCKADDLAGNWNQLVLILTPLCKEKPPPVIFIASDFAGFPTRQFAAIPFTPLTVGKTGDNAGITRAVLQPLPEDPARQVLFYQIQNFAKAQKTVDVQLKMENNIIDAYDVTLNPGQALDRSAEVRVSAPAQIRIQLKPDDALATDNDIVIFAKPAEKIRVAVKLPNPFLQKAVSVLPSIEIASNAPIQIASELQDQPGIYFLSAPATAPAGNVVHWNDSHPGLRFLDASVWRFSHCSALQPPTGADILVETQNGPVGYAVSSPAGRRIVFGFGLSDSNLPLLGGFPVLLQNSIYWISDVNNRPSVTFTDHDHPEKGPIGVSQYVNFADARESAILPQHPAGQGVNSERTSLDRRDVSTWFLILLTAIIMLEWWSFHRRIHVEI